MRPFLQCVRVTLCVIFALQFHVAQATPGQPGTLDSTWAASSPLGAGKVMTPIGSGNDFVRAMGVQPDGKVLISGACDNGADYHFCVARYNANGTLDLSWSGTGKVITPISNNDGATAMAVQPDGKVLLASNCNDGTSYDFCTIRYNANGTLDLTWNGTGKVITPIGGNDSSTSMVLQPDGKVLLAGTCIGGANDDFCAVRYNANGTLDLSWNGTGKVITPIGSRNDFANTVAVQPDGKVLLAGNCEIDMTYHFCAARYSANGTLDSSWNGTGKVITLISDSDSANTLAVQPDGKVLLAGSCSNGTNADFCVLRYHSSGTLDSSWNGAGTVMTPIGSGNDYAYSVALQPDGKVLLAGSCSNGTNADFCVLRYHSNGTLDSNWNGAGTVMTPIGNGYDISRAMALQPDGKVLLVGHCENDTSYDFCAARYDGGPFGYKNCSLDIDGDNRVLATTDSLIHARIALGITGNTVTSGITFPPTATRNTWPLIRDYLVTQCGMSLVQ